MGIISPARSDGRAGQIQRTIARAAGVWWDAGRRLLVRRLAASGHNWRSRKAVARQASSIRRATQGHISSASSD